MLAAELGDGACEGVCVDVDEVVCLELVKWYV